MSIKSANELKRLQTAVSVAQSEYQQAKEYAERCRQILTTAQTKLTKFNEASKEVIVTEHALLRYLERVALVDLDAARKAILTEPIVQYVRDFRSGKFPADGFKVVAKDGVIVTIET